MILVQCVLLMVYLYYEPEQGLRFDRTCDMWLLFVLKFDLHFMELKVGLWGASRDYFISMRDKRYHNIPKLRGDNYKVWKETCLQHLGWMDIDFAIRKDDPPIIIKTSSLEAERSNCLFMMFIKIKISTVFGVLSINMIKLGILCMLLMNNSLYLTSPLHVPL
ncbi:hypothetical protein CR513_46777, partial [Mucuna pruriens]